MSDQGKRGGKLSWKQVTAMCTALLLLVLPKLAQAAEFTAKMVLTDGGKAMPGKIYVKGDKMRQEFTDEHGQSITIVRKDRKVVYVVIPQDKIYVEMPLKKEMPGQFLHFPDKTLKKQKVGSETVSGYSTERYQVIVSGGSSGPVVQNFWMCDQLGMPVKMECKEKSFSVEYKDIKEGRVEDKLFEPPPGFKKVTQATGLL
jgi:hypothetical protein